MPANKVITLLRRTLIILSAVLLLVTTSSSTISALGTTYFDTQPGGDCDLWNGNITADLCNDNNHARLIAGESQSVVKTKTKVRAYFDGIPHTSIGGVEQVDKSKFPGNLEITIYGANYCPTAAFTDWADSAKGDGHYSIDGAGSTVNVDSLKGENITHFIIGGVDRYGIETPNGSAACNDTRKVNVTADMLQWADGISGVFYVDITANHIDKYRASENCETAPGSCDGILNSFTFRETGGTSHDYKIAQVGAVAAGDNGEGFATTIRQVGSADHSTFVSRFGADCTVVNKKTPTALKFFDLDFSTSDTQTQGQVHLYLRRESDGKWWRGQGSAGSPDANNWNTTKGGWDPGPKNGGTTTWDFTANPQDKFRLYISHVGSILVQQFTTPYDGIYYERSCETTIRPSQSIAPNGSPQLETGGNARITSNLKSIVDYAGSVNSAKVRAWYSNSPNFNNYNAAGAIPLPGGNWISAPTPVAGKQLLTHTDDITNLNPGSYTYLCSDLTTSTDDPLHTHIDPVHTGDCQPLQLSYQPYLSIYGGDAIAGAAPNENITECTPNGDAGFLSWNNDASPWAGAGSQLAVQAMGDISSFASGLDTANAPYRLSFANDEASDAADYGGHFMSTNGANCDYMNGLGPLKPAHDYNNLNIINGGPTTEYLKGDVVIKGNYIKYASGSWASTADIPNFKLVVIGNIYIEPSVEQLDGTYVAIPDADRDSDSDPTGIIETCAMSDTLLKNSERIQAGPVGVGYYNTCNNQLTINGAFVAKQVRFDRTFGTLKDAKVTDRYNNNQAAENFVYSPEMWIASTPGIPQGANAYTGLPPVL